MDFGRRDQCGLDHFGNLSRDFRGISHNMQEQPIWVPQVVGGYITHPVVPDVIQAILMSIQQTSAANEARLAMMESSMAQWLAPSPATSVTGKRTRHEMEVLLTLQNAIQTHPPGETFDHFCARLLEIISNRQETLVVADRYGWQVAEIYIFSNCLIGSCC